MITVGIVGLGVIGGSLAKAFTSNGVRVLGTDISEETMKAAFADGAIAGELDEENIRECHMVMLAVPSPAAIKWIKRNAYLLHQSQLVVDCCGIKRAICEIGFDLMKETELNFVGGHPMAGFNLDGYENSRADMFNKACFVLCQKKEDTFQKNMLCHLLSFAGFKNIAFMTPEAHDKTIAYTSQLSHIVPSALINSGSATFGNVPIAGGSFRDMTRVANLNEVAWTALCMENRDNLIDEINSFIHELFQYRDALISRNAVKLKELFAMGSENKQRFDDLSDINAKGV